MAARFGSVPSAIGVLRAVVLLAVVLLAVPAPLSAAAAQTRTWLRPAGTTTWFCDPAGRCRRTPAEGYLLRPNYDPGCGVDSQDRRAYCASRAVKPQPTPRIDIPRVHPRVEPPSILDPQRPGRITVQPPAVRIR